MNDIENLELHVMTISDLDSIADLLESKFDDFWNYNILKEELQADNSKYIFAKKRITKAPRADLSQCRISFSSF